MADYLTLADLKSEVGAAIKDPALTKDELMESVINQVYLNEIPFLDDFYPLFWLVDFDDSLNAKNEASISGLTIADPGVITTSAAHGFVVGDIVSIYGIVGTTQLNNRTYRVNTTPLTTTLTLIDLDGYDAISTVGMTAWSSGGTIVHRGLSLSTGGKDVQTIIKAGFFDYEPMTPIGIDEIEANSTWWGDGTSRPTRFQHRKAFSASGGTLTEVNQLLWFPGCDNAYDLKYWYQKRLARLAAETDIPLMPPQFHQAISAGAITRLQESQVQVENQVIWPQLYKLHQQMIIDFNRKWWQAQEKEHFQKPYLL